MNRADDLVSQQDSDEDEDDSDSSDSDETSSPAPTGSPEVFTEEPLAETTPEPILPTIVIDTGRGDSMGGHPDDYKSIIYFEDKSYHKVPLPYKSYEYVDAGKKTGYELDRSNHVDKSMQVYKIQVSTGGRPETLPPQLLENRLMRHHGNAVADTRE